MEKIKKNKKVYLPNRQGYVLLYSVVILGMVVLAMALYLSWLAVFSLQEKNESRDSKIAQSLADTCAQSALMALWNNAGAGGATRNNLFGGTGDCSYAISGSGENRTIDSTGVINNVTRKTKVLVNSVTNAITYTSWREVADF
jgi:hypothetical protein